MFQLVVFLDRISGAQRECWAQYVGEDERNVYLRSPEGLKYPLPLERVVRIGKVVSF
jgi:hypothetical protein